MHGTINLKLNGDISDVTPAVTNCQFDPGEENDLVDELLMNCETK